MYKYPTKEKPSLLHVWECMLEYSKQENDIDGIKEAEQNIKILKDKYYGSSMSK